MGGMIKLRPKRYSDFIFTKSALRTCIYTAALVCGAEKLSLK